MKLVSNIPIFGLALSLLGGFPLPSVAQESRWGSPDEDTVKFIKAVEASSACSPQPDLKDIFADDFQGTSPTGRRYGKEEAITTDTKSLSRDCQLGEVKVRFFGDSIAIAYGAESTITRDNNGKETKRCLVWTDTWLKRAGKWQIVAAQDTIVPCNPQAVLRALDYRLLARSVTQASLQYPRLTGRWSERRPALSPRLE